MSKSATFATLLAYSSASRLRLASLSPLREPTQPMRTEAASAGFYTSPWGQHPKIQLLTIAELLAGKRMPGEHR